MAEKKRSSSKKDQAQCPHNYIGEKTRIKAVLRFQTKSAAKTKGRKAGSSCSEQEEYIVNRTGEAFFSPFICSKCGDVDFFPTTFYGLEKGDIVLLKKLVSDVMDSRVSETRKQVGSEMELPDLIKKCSVPIIVRVKPRTLTRGKPRGYQFSVFND